jgi:hypothetical protein
VGINTPSSFIAYSCDTACARGVTPPRRPRARVFVFLPRLVLLPTVVVVVVVVPTTRAVIVCEHAMVIVVVVVVVTKVQSTLVRRAREWRTVVVLLVPSPIRSSPVQSLDSTDRARAVLSVSDRDRDRDRSTCVSRSRDSNRSIG